MAKAELDEEVKDDTDEEGVVTNVEETDPDEEETEEEDNEEW